MNTFVFLLILLLLLSITTNLLMYNKCYIAEYPTNFDPKLNYNITMSPFNIYYVNDDSKIQLLNNLKHNFHTYEKNNNCVILLSEPTDDDYKKINNLSNIYSEIETEHIPILSEN